MSLVDGIRWRLSTSAFYLMARGRKCRVTLGKNIRAHGVPIVSGGDGGLINIGDNCVIVSSSRATALGVRSPTILRLLTAGANISIGADCGLSGTVVCAAKSVTIGKRCLIGADVMIFDTDFHNHEASNRRYSSPNWENISRPVVIGDDVFIGTRSTICKGVAIGPGAIVAAGSVVVTDIAPYSIYGGNPARLIGHVPNSPVVSEIVR